MTEEETKVLDEAYEVGCEAEQALADDIISKIGENEVNKLDVAFQGAYAQFTGRMLRFFPKELLIDMINDIDAGLVGDSTIEYTDKEDMN
jgi:hypothetical protein